MKAFERMLAASYVSSTKFMLAKGPADDAHLDASVARLELEQHQRTHPDAN